MSVTGIKKTLNLHKYSVRVNSIMLNWKIILPVICAVTGLFFGCLAAKGEGAVYKKTVSFFVRFILDSKTQNALTEIIKLLLFPSAFAALLFFTGLSAYGAIAANVFPAALMFITGMISCYMYSTYTLKGLAYCVIMIFPYAVLTAVGIILCASECIRMSELTLRAVSKTSKLSDYSFKIYCTQFLRNYLIIAAAAGLKYLLSRLFGGLFLF